jgi:hypothetical protein
MRAIQQPKAYVDFKAVSSAALNALDFVVPQLLPGGRRESGEWVARNPTRNDAKLGSFKVNLKSGVWCDFATGDKGGDIIDLKAYLHGKSKLEAARDLATMLNVQSTGSTSLTGNVRDYQPKATANIAATPAEAREPAIVFPTRTKPDEEGKPRFMVVGDEGPRARDNEKRRHIYKRGGVPIRIKIMTRAERRALNAYRVTDANGTTGWQYRKPEGFKSVPYVAGDLDSSSMVFWPVVKGFCDTYVPASADGQVGRVAQRFGLIAAGGEIATLYKIVPWSRGDAVKAAALCFEQWLAARGGHEAAETAASMEQVRSFLLANGVSRFIPAWEENPPKGMNARDVAGYREQMGDGWDYYVTTTAWKEICAGLDPRRTAAMLRQKGYIEGEGAHIAKSVRVPEYGKMRLYHIRSTFLEDANEA